MPGLIEDVEDATCPQTSLPQPLHVENAALPQTSIPQPLDMIVQHGNDGLDIADVTASKIAFDITAQKNNDALDVVDVTASKITPYTFAGNDNDASDVADVNASRLTDSGPTDRKFGFHFSVVAVITAAAAIIHIFISVGIVDEIDWVWVGIAYCILLAVEVARNTSFLSARRCLLRRSGLFTKEDIAQIDSTRLQLDGEWLSALLSNSHKKNWLRAIDMFCRKGSHIVVWGSGLLFFPFVGSRTAEFSLGGSVLKLTIAPVFCFLSWRYQKKSDERRWRLLAFLYGGSDRIRDGQYGQINLLTATASSMYGIIGCIFLAYMVLPAEEDVPAEWNFVRLIIYLPLAIGDALGEIIGTPFGRHQFQVRGWGEINKKSIEGCAAVFFGSFLPCLLVTLLLHSDRDEATSKGTKLGLPLSIAVLTTVTETLSFRSTDNFTIPVANALLVTVWRATIGFWA
jgi:hypothetical protein